MLLLGSFVFCFCFWAKVLQCSLGWPQTQDILALISHVKRSQACTICSFVYFRHGNLDSSISSLQRGKKWNELCVYCRVWLAISVLFWPTALGKSETNKSCFPDFSGWVRDCASRTDLERQRNIFLLKKHTCFVWPSPGVSGLVLYQAHPVSHSQLLYLELALCPDVTRTSIRMGFIWSYPCLPN